MNSNLDFDSKLISNSLNIMIIKKCEDHNIRLTPNEYKLLIEKYKEKYLYNIDVCSLIDIAEVIVKRGK